MIGLHLHFLVNRAAVEIQYDVVDAQESDTAGGEVQFAGGRFLQENRHAVPLADGKILARFGAVQNFRHRE